MENCSGPTEVGPTGYPAEVALMSQCNGFTEEQKSFLQGLAMGADVARAARGLTVLAGAGANPGAVVRLGPASGTRPSGPEHIHVEARDRFLAEGKALSKEERAKRDKDPLTMWDEIRANAREGVFPKGTD